MKKLFSTLLSILLLYTSTGACFAVQPMQDNIKLKTTITAKPNIRFAFVFDGPSDHNTKVLKQFQKTISKSVEEDYSANFPDKLVFVGDWTESGIKKVSNEALESNAAMVISLGYLSTQYLSTVKNKSKFVITIDQYGLRDFGDGFFNPVQQAVQKVDLFKRLTTFNKVAILINENYYKTRKDWKTFLAPKFAGKNIDFTTISVNGDINSLMEKIPSDVDAVFVTPLYNLSLEQRKDLFGRLNAKKVKTFSTVGKEDVEIGCLLGSGALDLDRKLAEATSFNIQGVLKGERYKSDKIHFYEDEILYINSDTADGIGYMPQLRLLNSAEIISSKQVPKYNLTAVFDTLDKQNKEIERKRILVKAAKKASLAANLKYLPTFGVNLGFQQYSEDFAESAKLTTPEKTGIFQMGLEQVIYSPALVTNILIKHKMIDFQKSEEFMTEQNMGIDVALLYIETLILENTMKTQKEYVKESRENLAIARVRERMGYCGKEEILRWASQLNINEQNLLDMQSDLKNVKISINKILDKPQNQTYELDELKATDPAFYTSDLHVINYVRTPQALEKFTQLLVQEAIDRAPELDKLKAAMKMKDYEAKMYYQKFILPDAKLTYDYTSLFGREFTSPVSLPLYTPSTGLSSYNLAPSKQTFGRLGIFAQWKPIEGGTKFAEIARIKQERAELQAHMDEVEITLEEHIRSTVNNALAAYFSIEKNYKAMFASQENYVNVKEMYLKGQAPISQVIDAQQTYLNSKLKASNSQYVFFKELVWVQRGICAVNWSKASPEAKAWVEKIKTNLVEMQDISL